MSAGVVVWDMLRTTQDKIGVVWRVGEAGGFCWVGRKIF